MVSLGTSGVVSAVGTAAPHDPDGIVAGFADATGRQLPLVCTLNGAPVLAAVATMLGVDFDELDRLALSAPAGAEGLTLVPYFEGERSPNLPDSAGALHGVTTRNLAPANVARAAVEGLLSSMAYCIDKISAQGVGVERIFLVGGGARSAAVRRIAPAIFGRPVQVPTPGEYVAHWCRAAGGMGCVASGFATAMAVRCHRIVHRRSDARGVGTVSRGSAADLGTALIARSGIASRRLANHRARAIRSRSATAPGSPGHRRDAGSPAPSGRPRRSAASWRDHRTPRCFR